MTFKLSSITHEQQEFLKKITFGLRKLQIQGRNFSFLTEITRKAKKKKKILMWPVKIPISISQKKAAIIFTQSHNIYSTK